MTVDRWEIERAVMDAWTATNDEGLTFEARLARALEEHAGSRTIKAQLVRDVAELALGRVAELQAQHAIALEAQAAAHAAALERVEKSRDEWRELCQSANERLDERRTIRQELEQSAGDTDARVTITNGYVGWTVAGLEEIAYRLRTGGAGDDTPVEVDKARAVAMVPAPNLVQLDASPKAVPHLAPPLPNPVVAEGGLRVDWRVAAALVVVLLSIVAGVVIL